MFGVTKDDVAEMLSMGGEDKVSSGQNSDCVGGAL